MTIFRLLIIIALILPFDLLKKPRQTFNLQERTAIAQKIRSQGPYNDGNVESEKDLLFLKHDDNN
jgi:hypothetical protein